MAAPRSRDETTATVPTNPILSLSAALATMLLAATLVRILGIERPTDSVREASTPAMSAAGRPTFAIHRRADASFCKRCRAACGARRARCIVASGPGTKRRHCDGVEAACIIRCNDGLGCALPPPSLIRRSRSTARN